jgi:hypothetical protein
MTTTTAAFAALTMIHWGAQEEVAEQDEAHEASGGWAELKANSTCGLH